MIFIEAEIAPDMSAIAKLQEAIRQQLVCLLFHYAALFAHATYRDWRLLDLMLYSTQSQALHPLLT